MATMNDMMLRNEGQELRNRDRITAESNIIADRKIKERDNAQMNQIAQEQAIKGSIENAYQSGQNDMMMSSDGLGLNQDFSNSMQETENQSLKNSAEAYIEQAMQALMQGESPQNIEEMISSKIDPSIQPLVRDGLTREISILNQTQEAPVSNNPTNDMVDTVASSSPASMSAEAILSSIGNQQ